MKGTEKTARRVGKVFLALLSAILMPVLIWVALVVAIKSRANEHE